MTTQPIALFIHGALSTRRSFSFIKQQLLQDEADNNYAFRDFSYDIRKEPGEETVARLVKQALGYITSTMQNLSLICHSFGGVLGVAAARELIELHPALNIKIITLATPMGGSTAASMLRAMKPSSTFLKNVGAYDKFMKDFKSYDLPCRTRSIITTEGAMDLMPDANDGVVTVKSQLEYSEDANFHPVKVKLNHFEVLLSHEAVGYIKKELYRA
jgi:pimeloyl-ACP methyl ester carboxylesterase